MTTRTKYWLAHNKKLGPIYCKGGRTPVNGFHNGTGWYVLGQNGGCHPFVVRAFKGKKMALDMFRRLTGRRAALEDVAEIETSEAS